jgi:hypothetical protein
MIAPLFAKKFLLGHYNTQIDNGVDTDVFVCKLFLEQPDEYTNSYDVDSDLFVWFSNSFKTMNTQIVMM